MSGRFTITALGPFDLARSLEFLEDWPAGQPASGAALTYAACAEDDGRPTVVHASQTGATIEVTTSAAVSDTLARQITRALSLDVDGDGFADLGGRDPVIAALQAQRPGLRPVLFWSPWEAAAWAILSQRTSMRRASAAKQRIAAAHGHPLTYEGRTLHAFPSPSAVLALERIDRVPDVKLARLHSAARGALDGTLTGDHLRSLDPAEAIAALQCIDGIGPFSATLVAVRGAGHPDVVTRLDTRLAERIERLYPGTDIAEVTDAWRPYRSWCGFLVRSASEEQLASLQR